MARGNHDILTLVMRLVYGLSNTLHVFTRQVRMSDDDYGIWREVYFDIWLSKGSQSAFNLQTRSDWKPKHLGHGADVCLGYSY